MIKELRVRLLRKLVFSPVAISLLIPIEAAGQNIESQNSVENGRLMYRRECIMCHHYTKPMVSRSVKSIFENRDLDWIESYVGNSIVLWQSGDTAALRIHQFKLVDHNYLRLYSEEEISCLTEFLLERSKAED